MKNTFQLLKFIFQKHWKNESKLKKITWKLFHEKLFGSIILLGIFKNTWWLFNIIIAIGRFCNYFIQGILIFFCQWKRHTKRFLPEDINCKYILSSVKCKVFVVKFKRFYYMLSCVESLMKIPEDKVYGYTIA